MAIFNSYVKLPEGIWIFTLDILSLITSHKPIPSSCSTAPFEKVPAHIYGVIANPKPWPVKEVFDMNRGWD